MTSNNAPDAVATPTQPPLSKSRRHKRHKTNQKPEPVGPSNTLGNDRYMSPFLRLPIEIMGEILRHTSSPRDILSVTRCNKSLCRLLLSESAAYIWRDRRKFVGLPDPTNNFTEASYAAFVYNEGECDVCHQTKTPSYASFSLRLHICSQCDLKVDTDLLYNPHYDAVPLRDIRALRWLPIREKLYPQSGPFGYHIRKQWDEALAEWKACTNPVQYENKYKYTTKRTEAYMNLATHIQHWIKRRTEEYHIIKQKNDEFGREYCGRMGWDSTDFFNAPSWVELRKQKGSAHEYIKQRDLAFIHDKLVAEVTHLCKHRRARDWEARHDERVHDMKRLYNAIIERANKNTDKKSEVERLMPGLAAFRQIPYIKHAVLAVPDNNGVKLVTSATWEYVIVTMSAAVDEWRQAMLDMFSPEKNWMSPSKFDVHPAARVTERYVCKICEEHTNSASLDFSGLLNHQCPPGTWNGFKVTNNKWRPEMFVRDEKASTVLKKLVDITRVRDSIVDARRAFDALGPTIRCKSCAETSKCTALLDWTCLADHCHRHEDMQFEVGPRLLLDQLRRVPFHRGLRDKVVQRNPRLKPPLTARVIYGCRHCLSDKRLISWNIFVQKKAKEIREGGQPARFGVDEKEITVKNVSSYDYHGVLSHIKACHHSHRLTDEDFYVIKDLATKEGVESYFSNMMDYDPVDI